MKTEYQPQLAPVLAWHREAAEHYYSSPDLPFTGSVTGSLAQVIAAHDPHAETVRLLENAIEHIEGFESGEDACDLTAWEQELCRRSRTHLAKLKGTQ